jgi:hypothetical protein
VQAHPHPGGLRDQLNPELNKPDSNSGWTQHRGLANYGAWQIAVVATGLDDATSSKAVDQWGERGPIYTEATYGRAAEATFTELDAEPDKVTARLVLSLLRSLGVHTHADYQYLSA